MSDRKSAGDKLSAGALGRGAFFVATDKRLGPISFDSLESSKVTAWSNSSPRASPSAYLDDPALRRRFSLSRVEISADKTRIASSST